MSLIVYPYKRNKQSGEMVEIEAFIRPPFNDLFGLEIWRDTVWGSKVLKEMGCHLLYNLKHSDIFVEDEEIIELEIELLKIRNEIEEIADRLKIGKEALLFRIGNALEAIKVAKEYSNGGICIG